MTETIGTIYTDFIKEKFIKDKLREGKIPSGEEIDIFIKEMQVSNNNFTTPMLSTEATEIQEEEESSAEKMNSTFEMIEMDLSVALESLLKQGNKITDMYDSSFSRMKSFEKRIGSLKTTVGDLLFESKNSERHESLFYEKFESNDMVDLGSSTADVDNISSAVTLKVSEGNLISLDPSPAYISIHTDKNPAITRSEDVAGLEAKNLTDSTVNLWQHQTKSTEALAQAYVDVIIEIPNGATEVNKIVIDPASVNIKTQINVELSYSQDKINWLFPDGERKKRLIKKEAFNFKNTKSRYWRIRLVKFGNDGFFGNSYVYNFGLKNVLFIGKKYEKVNRHDRSFLYSKVIVPKELEKISGVNIRTCQETPEGTAIKYEVAPLTEDQISGDKSGLYYYIVDIEDKDSFSLDFLKLASEETSIPLSATESIEYEGKGEFDYSLNFLSSSIDKNSLVLMRGLGNNETEKSSGWTYNGIFYSTYVLVEEKDGESFDIGDTEMIVNGDKVTGVVKLKPGLNNIVCPKQYWKAMDLATLPQAATEKVDAMASFNHKYLVEGIGSSLYGVDLTQIVEGVALSEILDPKGVYSRRRSIWSVKMKEETFGVFESKTESALDVFSYKMDNNSQERIIIKSTKENGLMDRERFSIISKIQGSKPIKGLIFKAELTTEDPTTTPVLTEYLLKFR